jgi:hypothetical protein
MSRQRLDVKQAAEALGISSEGVRKRIKRGSLASEKDSDGKVWVWLDGGRTRPDGDWTGSDERQDENRNSSHSSPDGFWTEDRTSSNPVLTEALRAQVAMLQTELEDWKGVVTTRDEELRRKDHNIAALTERIPELEPPRNESPEPRDAPETASEGKGRRGVTPEEQEPAERRSWLYRVFFGQD